jgi:hypothetical protein
MQARLVTRIERWVDGAASGLFAGAAAYAAYAGFAVDARWQVAGGETAGAAVVAFLLCFRALNAVRPEARKLPVPVFDVRDIEPIETPELLLTERYQPASRGSEEPLVLDDVLAALGPDSRVVRLFDPAAMPTPAQLNARIERHLETGAPPAPSQDASQALHDALADLRRSLR